MDVLDKFFTKYSYKFPKGYPDMNNEQDILLMESILEELGIDLKEAINRKRSSDAAEDLVNSELGKKHNIKKFTSGKYKNRINSTTLKTPEELVNLFSTHFNIPPEEIKVLEPLEGNNDSRAYKMYEFDDDEFGQVNISVSTGKKGTGGKANEKNFNANINQYASKNNPITIELVSPDKTKIIKNVSEAIDVAGGTQNKLKADSALLDPSGNKIANISLKQPEGFRWASLNNDRSPFRKNFIEAALNDPDFPVALKQNPSFEKKIRYLMYKEGTDNRITLVIVKNAPFSADEENIFGTDDPKTIVVGRTFKPDDFEFNEETNTLTIKVNHIYESMKEIEGTEFEPVFVVAQHSGNPYGLDFRSYPTFMAKLPKKGTGIEIDYEDIVN